MLTVNRTEFLSREETAGQLSAAETTSPSALVILKGQVYDKQI